MPPSLRAAALITLLVSAPAITAGAQTAGIDAVLRNAVARKIVPGVVAVVTKDGVTVYQGAFGQRSATPAAPMERDAIFRIASMTKPITSVAVLQLVEAGKVKLDASAGDYLPEIAQVQVIDHIDPKTGAASLRPPRTPVTVRQLLSHTSGYGYALWDQVLTDYRAKVTAHSAKPTSYREALRFDPGTKWQYGSSTAWLGRLVEAVSGRNLEQYFREKILDPLAMTDTSFDLTPAQQLRLVTERRRAPNGVLRETANVPLRPVKLYAGDGGLYSTATDYARFMSMILGGGQLGGVHVLQAETVAMMTRNQIGSLSLSALKTVDPRLSLSGQVPGRLDKFGLGFAINTQPVEGGRASGSLAWAGIENTYFWIDPGSRTSAVIMMQTLPFLDRGAMDTLTAFEHAVYTAFRQR